MVTASVVIVCSSALRKGKKELQVHKRHSLQRKLQTSCRKREARKEQGGKTIEPLEPGEDQEEEGFTRRLESSANQQEAEALPR